MMTGLVEPKLTLGGSCAPAGLVVTDAVKLTLPVKPLAGVMVMVEVFPLVAPGVMETFAPPTVKVGGGGAVTMTEVVPETGLKLLSPEYATEMVSFPTASDPAGIAKVMVLQEHQGVTGEV
jgi:hypothetical protein